VSTARGESKREANEAFYPDLFGDSDVDGADRDRFRTPFKTGAGDAGYRW
jgi:hypothetical protein